MRLRLLERVRHSLEQKNDPLRNEDLILSIERHLSLILNTHQSASKSAPDYGLPDFMSLMGSGDMDNLRRLSRAITDVIRKYEPRLTGVTVTHIPGKEGVVEFSLSGSFFSHNQKQSIYFQTSIIPDGSITVRK